MKHTLILLFALIAFAACKEVEEQPNTPQGNFEALWQIIDQHYCFLLDKQIDWNEVHDRYAARVSTSMTSRQLFDLLSEMLDELKDGHVNLSAAFASSYYRKWWSDYPQNYDERIVQQYYFNFNYQSVGAFDYGMLPQNIGYIHYSTFASSLGKGNIDLILNYFSNAQALIFDVRDNTGGNLTSVTDLVNRFVTERTLAGYIVHKTGPGHNDFDKPFAYYIDPVGDGHLAWRKPVIVLTNRSTFSAANNFVSIMKFLPNVTIVGATTGGGSGMPFNSELPNGWSIRFSACSILDAAMNSTEFGVSPSDGCAVDMDPQAALQGHDTILDFAVELVTNGSAASASVH
ncbi:MAG: S41 family peptidase [Firmicutes bacterium]|nr:S41 family peptidase [Bacillota bacterium]MCM1400659.1 S41 family peptidase [Bacteroides sp.]MCM1476350.1 S41 family peptidase [Bacteroides sp.]